MTCDSDTNDYYSVSDAACTFCLGDLTVTTDNLDNGGTCNPCESYEYYYEP